MKLVFRIISLLAIVATFLAGAGIAAYAISGSPWTTMAVVLAVSLLMAKVVDEVLDLGVFFGQRKAERELREAEQESDTDGREMPPDMKKAIEGVLNKYGLRPVSMHRVGDDGSNDEEEISQRMQEVADEITDPDLQEFAFHFAHIASDCPSSVIHAARMHELVAFIDARLRASTVAPQNDSNRPQVH